MPIFINDFYNSFKYKKKKININKIKNTLYYLKIKNNINYFPIKLIYFIIYLEKFNYKFIVINNIINKIFKNISNNISKFIFNIIIYKWNNIINICINNNKQNELINYFIDLYELYLSIENCPGLFIIQTKHILNIRIGYMRHLEKYLKLNIFDTIYYIDIIFSKINKKYISIDYIFNINN